MNPSQASDKHIPSLVALITVLVGGMFVADFFFKIGIANGAPYVAAILLSLWFPKRLLTLVITMACSGLTIIGFFLSANDASIWPDLSNRMIALIAIWFTGILLLHRKRAEEALQAGKDQYQHLIEQSFQGIVIHRDGQTLFTNRSFDRMLERCEPNSGQTNFDLVDHIASEDRQQFDAHLKSIDRDVQDESTNTFRVLQDDGTSIWVDMQSHIVSWEGQLAVQSSIYDITDRIRAEEALAARVTQMEAVRTMSIEIARELDLNELLQLVIRRAVELVDAAGAGVIFLWDGDRQQLVSHAWYGLGEWIGKVRLEKGEGFSGTIAKRRQGLLVNNYQQSPYACARLAKYVKDTSVLGEPLVYRDQLLGVITLGNAESGLHFTNQDRELLLLFGVQAAIAIENAKLFREVHTQSEQLIQANAALRSSEERYRTFLEQSSEGIFRVEFRTDIQLDGSLSEQLVNICSYGYIAECNDVMAKMHGHNAAEELVGSRLGSLFPMETRQNQIFLENFVKSQFRIIDAETHEVGLQKEKKVFLNNLLGLKQDGKLKRLWGSRRDVTERKQLEEGLFQAKKMAALGTLAGGIAHDFNNILTSILGYTELSLYDTGKETSAWRNLHEVLTAGKRAKDLVNQVLTFSRQNQQDRCDLNLSLIVMEVLSMIRASLPQNIEVVQDIDHNIGTVKANSTQMHQVVMNLCANAEHAMRKTGGRLGVELSAVELHAHSSAQRALAPGRYVKLQIRDSGKGMTSEVTKRIFEPFFTTKGIGEGTGMGLAVVHGIVVQHGGSIEVNSQPGQGSCFTVYLPKSRDETDCQRAAGGASGDAVFVIE